MTNATTQVPAKDDRLETAYRWLSGDDSDERACSAIPDSACTDVPRNYLLNVSNGAATKLAEQLASPGLVLPWLLTAIGAPAVLSGLLVPLKQTGSLLPQLAVAGRIRTVEQRKWVWVGAGLVQALLLVAVCAFALLLPGTAGGVLILVAFTGFSIASGVGSVAFQDVMGKTIPKGRRGRLLSNRALVGGGLTLLAAGSMRLASGNEAALDRTLPLIAAAALLWALGSAAFAAISEEAGATAGGRSMLKELAAGTALMRAVPGYRRFLIARGLLLAVELAAPFFALHAAQLYGHGLPLLGLFVFAAGLAGIVSSPLWGRWADSSSRTVMALSGAIGMAAGLLALGLAWLPGTASYSWLYAGVFLLSGIAEGGLRLGRKTYLVDAAPSDERPLYTAFANTVAGGLALAGGLLGVLAQAAGPAAAIVAVALLATLGGWVSWRLPEAADVATASDGRTPD